MFTRAATAGVVLAVARVAVLGRDDGVALVRLALGLDEPDAAVGASLHLPHGDDVGRLDQAPLALGVLLGQLGEDGAECSQAERRGARLDGGGSGHDAISSAPGLVTTVQGPLCCGPLT